MISKQVSKGQRGVLFDWCYGILWRFDGADNEGRRVG